MCQAEVRPYGPPNSDPSVLNSLNYSLFSIHSEYPIVLCGDFNLPQINWMTISPTGSSSPSATLMCSIVADNFLTQIVNFPTRQNNILDLILVSDTKIIFVCILLIIYQELIMMLFSLLFLSFLQPSKAAVDFYTTTTRLILTFFVIHASYTLGLFVK